MAFLRGRGTHMRVGEGEGDGVGGGAWLGPELLPTRLQYSSSWLLALLGGVLLLPWPPPPPLLVRRYDVVFSELQSQRQDSSKWNFGTDCDLKPAAKQQVPDGTDGCWRNVALRPRTSRWLAVLLRAPEQTSLAKWRPGRFSYLALAFCAGWGGAVLGLSLRARRVRGRVGAAVRSWTTTILACDWNLGVRSTCVLERDEVKLGTSKQIILRIIHSFTLNSLKP